MNMHSGTARRRILLLMLSMIGLHGEAHALTYLVGGDGGCDYDNLQAAINGVASNPGPDSIRVANSATYTQQALTIGSQDLIIEGGYATCGAATPTGITTIDGAGGAPAPVVRISGSGVRDLRNLTIRGGDSTGSDYGGGIQFSGRGDLILRNVAVSNNRSSYGGGIYFNGSGGLAILTLETDTVILGNTAANSGGGIYMNGNSRLFMLRDRTSVQGNTAVNGDGGGIFVRGPALADIASPGYVANAAIYDNAAMRGGGLAVVGSSDGKARARLFGVDAGRPVRLHRNRANSEGGAIWAQPWVGTIEWNDAIVCAYDVLVDGNRAPDGAAMYADNGGGVLVSGYVTFGVNSRTCNVQAPEPIGALGRVACTAGVNGCNSIANNVASNNADVQTDGATIRMKEGGHLQMQNVLMIGNAGGTAVRNDDLGVEIASSMIVNNFLSADVMRFGDGWVDLQDDTIANNVNSSATHLFRFDAAGDFKMKNTIVWQPGKKTLLYPGGGQNLDSDDIRYNIASDVTTLPQGPYNLQADPRFTDPEKADFSLRISSPALDFSPPVAGDNRGIDGRPRDQQVRPGPPRALLRDVGALERQPSDPYLVNASFDANLRLWTNNFPDYTRWIAQGDGANSGAVEMFIPGDQTGEPGGFQVTSMYGLTQCFAVPWPGLYTLTARGLTKLTDLVDFPDTATLNWRLRYNSANCAGPADVEGDLRIPAEVGWNSPLAPATIVIDAAGWNFQTTLEISPGVLQNLGDPLLQNPLFGRVDNIVLRYEEDAVDKIFWDGFDP